MPFAADDRFRISLDHRGAFHINQGMEDLGELRLRPRTGPVLTLGGTELRIRAFGSEWRLTDETGATHATFRGGRRPRIEVDGETFTLRRVPFSREARLTDPKGTTLLRLTTVPDGRRSALVAEVVEGHPHADVLFPFAAVAVVLKGSFRPPKARNPEGERLGAWARGGQWGFASLIGVGAFESFADLSGGGSGGGDSAGGGFGGGDFGGGGDGGGGGSP
jgi:uncharacterized membrane protein YgcG